MAIYRGRDSWVFVPGHVGHLEDVPVVHIQPIRDGRMPKAMDVTMIYGNEGFCFLERVFDVCVSERQVVSCSENQTVCLPMF